MGDSVVKECVRLKCVSLFLNKSVLTANLGNLPALL